jgi:hypothetical protein
MVCIYFKIEVIDMKFSHVFFSILIIAGTSLQAAGSHRRHAGKAKVAIAAMKARVARHVSHKRRAAKAHKRPSGKARAARSHAHPRTKAHARNRAAKPARALTIPRSLQGLGGAVNPARALTIPRSLQDLDRAAIHPIEATQQTGVQCGSRAVANALGIQDCILAEQPLISANIRANASKYDHILINQILEWNQVADLANENHLFNAHIMAKTPSTQKNPVNPYIVYSTDAQEYSLDNLVETMLTHPTFTAHVICNTGGHWVLVTIIKQEGHIPQILYMDSCNGQLGDDSVATAYIHYLYDTCIA